MTLVYLKLIKKLSDVYQYYFYEYGRSNWVYRFSDQVYFHGILLRFHQNVQKYLKRSLDIMNTILMHVLCDTTTNQQ